MGREALRRHRIELRRRHRHRPRPAAEDGLVPLALTYDGNHIRIYVDGELVGTDTSPEPQVTAGELQIGGSTEHNDWFDGRIDELRVYDRALDAGEIAADEAAPIQTPHQGPIAAYSFDEGEGETVTDLAGEHDAAIEGAEWTTRGRFGGAMEFDRPSLSYLSVPDSPEFDFSEEFTLEAWVRPNEETYWSPTIVKQTGKEEGDDSFAYRLYAAGYEESHPLATIKSGPKEEEFLGVAPSLPTSAWSHLSFTYDGDKMSLYIDGELIEQAHSDPPIFSEGDLQIGGATELHDYFDGRIDEVRIYDRALDAGEIAADKAAPIQTPQRGPIAAYSFDEGEGETVEDLTGNGHTGTIEGATWTDRGRFGGALDFVNSPGDVVKIADSPGLQLTEEFTLEAWVRPTSTVVNGTLITKTTENFYSYTLYAAGSPYPGKPFGATAPAPYSGAEVEAPEPLEPHRWNHVAMTYDGSKLRLYLDGELVDTEDGVDPMASEGPLELGGMDVFGDYLQGRLDEVRIYDRALDAGEIAADKAAPIQTPQRGPIAAYSFDEGEGTTVEDLTGSGHSATIEGADWARGRYGGAMEFDASENDVLKVADAPDLDFTEEFTLEAWVRPSAENNQWAPIATKTQGGEEEGNGYAYLLYEGGGQSSFPFGGIENPAEEEFEASAAGKLELERRVWAHVALTYDGAKLRLWVDGELIDESDSEDPRITEGDLEIGGFSSHGDFFDGRIDELRVYDRALDAGEIAADKAAPIQTPQRGPIAAYSFDEGEGTTVEDLTGSGHSATIEGATWTDRGRFGGAMEFDASENDVLKVADAPDLDFTEEFTLEAWVRPSDANHYWAPIVDKQASSSKTFAYWLYAGQWEEKPSGGTESSSEEGTVTAPDPLPKTAWSHVALTYDGNHIRIYVDGELVGTDTSPEPQVTAGELQIGGSTEHNDWFDGRIDELRVYDRALGGGEIEQTLNASFPTAITEAATGIGANSAILKGTTVASGGATEYYFEYGTTEAYGKFAVGEELGGGREKIEIAEAIIWLTPETTYHYRLVAENIAGKAYGEDQTLTTLARTMTVGEEEELTDSEGSMDLIASESVAGPGDFYGMMWTGDLQKMASEGIYESVKNSGARFMHIAVAPGEQTNIDYAFTFAAENNITVLPGLGGGPTPKEGSNLEKDWIEYAQKMVHKYGPGSSYPNPIKAWVIWNEPNMSHADKVTKPGQEIGLVTPGKFANFFGKMAKAVRAAPSVERTIGEGETEKAENDKKEEALEDEIQILTPDLYGFRTPGCKPICHYTPRDFLEGMNAVLKSLDPSETYDAIALHPYVFKIKGKLVGNSKMGIEEIQHRPENEEDVKLARNEVQHIIESVRNLKDRDNVPIWITELGFPVANPENKGGVPPVTKAIQELLVRATFTMLKNQRKNLNIRRAIYYNIQDDSKPGWEYHSGLLEADSDIRPAWTVYSELAGGQACPHESKPC